MDLDNEIKIKEFELLQKLEIETTKIRHTTFTALISISFVIPSLALQINQNQQNIIFFNLSMNKFVFLFGYIFFLFSVFHYHWYHRYSHFYRKRLKELEKELDFNIYSVRKRPILGGKYKLHFHWFLYILGLIYGFLEIIYTNLLMVTILLVLILILYLTFMYFSRFQSEEPNEN